MPQVVKRGGQGSVVNGHEKARYGNPRNGLCFPTTPALTPDDVRGGFSHSTFDIEIELREDLDPSNPRRGITFTAIPYSKYFSVKMVVSQSQAVKPIVSELKFMEITADSVKDVCGRFVKQAFTV